MSTGKPLIIESLVCYSEIAGSVLLSVRVQIETYGCKSQDDVWLLSNAFLGYGGHHRDSAPRKLVGLQLDAQDSYACGKYEYRFSLSKQPWLKAASMLGEIHLSFVGYTGAGEITDWRFVKEGNGPDLNCLPFLGRFLRAPSTYLDMLSRKRAV